MRDPPDAAFLLGLAEGADPALAERCRAIAGREARRGEGRYEAVHADLVSRYGAGEDGALLARLAADIRAGRFDLPGPERDAVELLLQRHALLRLEESNPDFIS